MKKLTIYTIALYLLLFLSACTVSKDTATPAAPLPTAYRNTAVEYSPGIGALAWKQFFTNTSLQRLIDSAIINNYDMQVAVRNIEAARLVLKQSKNGYLPDVKLQATAGINRPSDNSLTGLSLSQFLGKSYVEDYSLAASLSWEADIWGKIKNQKAKALAAYLQTEEARKLVQTHLISFVATGYYNLLMLDAQLSIAKKNLLLNDSTLTIIRLQYNAGQVTSLAVQQAEAQRLVAAQLIPQIEQGISVQENALSIAAAVLPTAIPRSGNLTETAFANAISAGVPSALLQNRPDVRSKELDLFIANASVGISKANMYPSFTITAAGGINSFIASNWFSLPASLFATAAGGLTQPLFQRKQLRTQFELAKVEREKTVIQFRQSVLTAVGEVSDALVKTEKLSEQQSIAAIRVNRLQEAISNAHLLFKNGMANYLEVITAQSHALQAELELAALRKEQLNAVIELYRSLGGGWK